MPSALTFLQGTDGQELCLFFFFFFYVNDAECSLISC